MSSVEKVVERAGSAIEGRRRQEMKRGENAGEIKFVRTRREVRNQIVSAAGGRAVACCKGKDVFATASRQCVDAGSADELVGAEPTNQRVCARSAIERTAAVVGDQLILAAAANGGFNGCIGGNADVVNQAADRRKSTGMQIDRLGRAVSRTIERVVAAAVVNGQRRRLRV